MVVDMRKSGLSLAKLKSYNRIHSKIQEMGASGEGAEGWLDTCRDIASSITSSDQFANMISDLVRLSSETGLSLKVFCILLCSMTVSVATLCPSSRKVS